MKKADYEAQQELQEIVSYLKEKNFPVLQNETTPGKGDGAKLCPDLFNTTNAMLLAFTQRRTKKLWLFVIVQTVIFGFHLLWGD